MYTRGIRVVQRDVINLSRYSSVGRLKIYNNNNICFNKSGNWKVVLGNLAKVCSRRTTYDVYHVSKSPYSGLKPFRDWGVETINFSIWLGTLGKIHLEIFIYNRKNTNKNNIKKTPHFILNTTQTLFRY